MSFAMAFVSGLIFGIGLIVSGMSNPAKVQGFLDLAGVWDPSLMFVMGGAILVGFFAFRYAARRGKSLLGLSMQIPTACQIDRRLILGSIVFGVGWGVAGFCPGPAITSLLFGHWESWVFVAAMITGMGLFEIQTRLAGVK